VHDSSREKMSAFVTEYLDPFRDAALEILDFGSQEVAGQPNSSYKTLFSSPKWRYRGLDMVPGANVDIVLTDPFAWQDVISDSIDLVISGQTFEHVDFFWISAFEIGRVLKPGGIAAIIAPSSGGEHRYPLDCWRYYPDGFEAIAKYLGFEVLDVCTDWGRKPWADSMLIMRKPNWDTERRYLFHRSLAHQRAVLSPDSFVEPIVEASPPGESILGALEPGERLSQIFASLRPVGAPSSAPSSVGAKLKRAVRERLGAKRVDFVKALLTRSELK
jgi:SAM-dependent methyltransferase